MAAGLTIVGLLMAASGVLVATETSLLHIRRARAEVLMDPNGGRHGTDDRTADLLGLLDDGVRGLGPVLLLLMALRLAAAGLLAVLVANRHGAGWAAGAMAALLVAGFVLTDVLPRTLALRSTDRLVLRLVPFALCVGRVLPVRWLALGLVGLGERLLPRPLRMGGPLVSEDEEELLVVADRALASLSIDADEHDLIESVIAFGDTLVREVMVPRPDMECVAADLSVAEAMEVAARNGHSRVPVSGDDVDDIIGVVHAKDLMRAHLDGSDAVPVSGLARLPHFVPETKQADDLLREMQADRYHLAIVVDEHGGTAGLVTMEDLLEEVVGEIEDEFDQVEPLAQSLAGGGLRVHGRMPIDELNDLLGEALPDGDWDTVGGLIFDALGHVPEVGEAVEVAGRRFGVEQVEGRRITRVRIGVPGEPR
ncbi:MAG: hemolysin family protein [Actinomycetota bacterium]|nr:hemolysin family protein [Actinomycetota bacterium]